MKIEQRDLGFRSDALRVFSSSNRPSHDLLMRLSERMVNNHFYTARTLKDNIRKYEGSNSRGNVELLLYESIEGEIKPDAYLNYSYKSQDKQVTAGYLINRDIYCGEAFYHFLDEENQRASRLSVEIFETRQTKVAKLQEHVVVRLTPDQGELFVSQGFFERGDMVDFVVANTDKGVQYFICPRSGKTNKHITVTREELEELVLPVPDVLFEQGKVTANLDNVSIVFNWGEPKPEQIAEGNYPLPVLIKKGEEVLFET